jgi:hypothetical protein
MGIHGSRCGAEGHPDGTAEDSEEDRFREELGADVVPGGAKGAAQADLGTALRALFASAWATRAEEGRLTLTWLGFSGLAVAARRSSTAVTRSFWARR